MTLSEKLLVAALLVQIGWTFVVMILAGRSRFGAVAAGKVDKAATLGRGGWPDDVQKISNNMNNQFETPTLFYALVLLALHLHLASLILAALAVIYVASRIGHTAIHATTNYVPHRFGVFMIGVIALVTFTVVVALDLIFGMII